MQNMMTTRGVLPVECGAFMKFEVLLDSQK